MSYNNRFKPNQYYPLPVNQAEYHDRPQNVKPNAQKPDESITINVHRTASDSQGQNDLKLVGASSWQIGDAIRISPDGGAHTTSGYMLDSVGGTVFPGQNSFPIHFGLINATDDLFESDVSNGITAYKFAGKGKAIDSDYIHTQDLHAMDSNSIFDSGRAYDMFLNERSSNKLLISEFQSLMPKNYIDRFNKHPKTDSDFGPYPGNILSVTPTNPEVFPIGFDSNAIAAGGGGGGGGGGAAADPESWS